MLAHDEPNAPENWQHLLALCPEARLVSGVLGIQAGYRACAEQAETPFFFAIDGDNFLTDAAILRTRLRPRGDEVLLWCARNPVNDLAYGHGGIKLFPTARLRETRPAEDIDISTSLTARSRLVRRIASEHRFDTDPYRAWVTAFREAVKLAKDVARGQRSAAAAALLDAWCTRGAVHPLGVWCIAGARAGRDYQAMAGGDPAALGRINDRDWLRRRFDAAVPAAP